MKKLILLNLHELKPMGDVPASMGSLMCRRKSASPRRGIQGTTAVKCLVVGFVILICPSTSQAVHDDVEDVYDRYNGPPLYRYHDRLSHDDPYQNQRHETDANDYWGNRYNGNQEPNRHYEHWLDRAITEMEDQH